MPIVRMPDGTNVRFDDNMSKEQIRSMIATKFPDFAANNTLQQPTFTPSEDALSQIQANNDAYNSGGKAAVKVLRGVVDFLTGTAEGVNSGIDSVLSGATFGFYDKLNPEAKARREKLQQRAESVGLGGANKIAQGTAEFGGMGLNPLNYIGGGYISKGTSALNKAARAAGVGGLIGGVAGAGSAESLEELPQNIVSGIGIGSAMGGALPLASAAVKGLGKISKLALSKTTGSGAEALERAFDAGKRKSQTFIDNMRGKVQAEDVVNKARQEIAYMNEGNADLYKANMEKAFANTEKLNTEKVRNRLAEIVNQETLGGAVPLSGEEKKVIEQSYKFLKPAMNNRTAQTTLGMDKIRQKIYDISTEPGTNANRIKKSIENGIKDIISEQNPEYRNGLTQYAKNKAEIKEIQDTFSLGDKARTDTALRKIQSLGRNNVQTNYGYRNALMDKLDFSGNIRDAAAGQLLNTWTPRGLQAGTLGGVNVLGAAMVPSILPKSAVYALASSPRTVGELAYGLGRLSTQLPKENITPYLAQYLANNQ